MRFDSAHTASLNLMLAECCRHVGAAGQRIDALQQVAAGDQVPVFARVELARAEAELGKLDQAIEMLVPLAERQPELRSGAGVAVDSKNESPTSRPAGLAASAAGADQAERVLTLSVEPLILLRVELLVAQDRIADAISLLKSARAKIRASCGTGSCSPD